MSTQTSNTHIHGNPDFSYDIALMNAVKNTEMDFGKSRAMQQSEDSMHDIHQNQNDKNNNSPSVISNIKRKTSITGKKIKNRIRTSKNKMRKMIQNKYIGMKGFIFNTQRKIEDSLLRET